VTRQALPFHPDSGRGEDAPDGARTALRPVQHLREVLARVSAAAPPEVRGRFLILTHRGPDPDALGACEGLRLLLSKCFGYEPVVATLGTIHRAENLALVRTLDLELEDLEQVDTSAYAAAALVDTQPAFGHTVLPEGLPVVAVFDHHVPPESSQRTEIAHEDVRLNLGATCSLIYEYLRDAGVEIDERTASALFCGIRYDTADLSRNTSPLDEEAYFETFRRADRKAIAAIDNPPLPKHYFREVHRALTLARQHGALVLALMGRVENPESVAEMADFLLRMKSCSWVVAGAAYEDEYILSLRTDYAFGKAYPLMRRVLDGQGSFGGHGHIAGGRIEMADSGESTIKSIERALRSNALAVIGAEHEDGIPPEGRTLTE